MLAVLSMVLDHLGVLFFPGCVGLRLAGRFAMPAFACLVGVHAVCHTRDPAWYARRLLLLGAISLPVWWLAFGLRLQLDVIVTLGLGVLGVQLACRVGFGVVVAGLGWLTLAGLLGSALPIEYGAAGVLAVVSAAGLALGRRWCLASLVASVGAFNAAWGLPYQLAGLAALPVILAFLMAPSVVGRAWWPRWLKLIFYPAHLLLLGFIASVWGW